MDKYYTQNTYEQLKLAKEIQDLEGAFSWNILSCNEKEVILSHVK